MTIVELLHRVSERGVTLSVRGDRLVMRGRADAVEEIKLDLAAHKPEIIEKLRGHASDAERLAVDLSFPSESRRRGGGAPAIAAHGLGSGGKNTRSVEY